MGDPNIPTDREVVRATINGVEREFPLGMSVLHAAQSLGLDIPSLCNDERISPCGACRICLVDIKDRSHPVISCMTRIETGMEIETDNPQLHHARMVNLLMLAQKYPAEAFTKFPEKPFHELSRKYGLTLSDFGGRLDPYLVDDSHPYIHVDMSRCIECYRCVRICEELPGQFVWQITNRGQSTRIVPNSGTTLIESSCISCGACVDTCPTGALEDKTLLTNDAPSDWTRTVCPYCGTGCEMNVGVRNDRIVQIKPAMQAPVNRGHLCVKGRYAFEFVDAHDRITEPMIRIDGDWKNVSWTEALDFTATRLREIIDRFGENSIGVLASARATNEENYLTQKFARVCIGTNNVDCCARVCHTPTAAAMKLMLGTGASTNSYNDIELAKTILICGANATECHPIIGERIKQAVLRNGAKLIVIDPRRIELARYADIHLQLLPGTNILLLNAIAAAIIDEKLVDKDFIENRVSEFEKFQSFISEYLPDTIAATCGLTAETIRDAARMYATEKPSMAFHGLGLTEHTQGTEGVMCIINLALLTGNIGRRGAGVNPLRGQNNVQGSAQMGCDPGLLTGSISLDDGRNPIEKVWRAPVPVENGLNLMQMMDSAETGSLKALWAIGYDVFLTNPNANKTERSLHALDLLIVQDMFLNETAKKFGHVFLPAASTLEKDGTFMNAERRIQRVRKAVDPRGNSVSDWEIICAVAHAMGKGEFFEYGSADEIWDEVRAVWKNAAGITYARLEDSGLQWNCPSEDHPGTEFLHADSFAFGKKTRLRRIEYRPTKEIASEEFPFILNTGRNLYQFNAGTMTERTRNAELFGQDYLFLSPNDSRCLKLANDDVARIVSQYGDALLPVRISDQLVSGQVFATFHTTKVFLNKVTSDYRDRFTQTPAYKVTAVRVEKP